VRVYVQVAPLPDEIRPELYARELHDPEDVAAFQQLAAAPASAVLRADGTRVGNGCKSLAAPRAAAPAALIPAAGLERAGPSEAGGGSESEDEDESEGWDDGSDGGAQAEGAEDGAGWAPAAAGRGACGTWDPWSPPGGAKPPGAWGGVACGVEWCVCGGGVGVGWVGGGALLLTPWHSRRACASLIA
jgi:hypothetical protein